MCRFPGNVAMNSRLRELAFGCLILASNLLFAQRGKVAKDLHHLPSGEWANVIVL